MRGEEILDSHSSELRVLSEFIRGGGQISDIDMTSRLNWADSVEGIVRRLKSAISSCSEEVRQRPDLAEHFESWEKEISSGEKLLGQLRDTYVSFPEFAKNYPSYRAALIAAEDAGLGIHKREEPDDPAQTFLHSANALEIANDDPNLLYLQMGDNQ